MILDLHGCSVNEAIAKLQNCLFSFKENNFEYELEIITGKGEGIIFLTTTNFLDSQFVFYEELDGKIIVYKDDKETNQFTSWTEELENFDKEIKEYKNK